MKVDGIALTAAACIPETRTEVGHAIAGGLIRATDAAHEGIVSLPVAGPTAAPEMAVAAARSALGGCGIREIDVDILIHAWVYDQGPDTWTPPHRVARSLGASRCEAIGIRQMSNGGACALHTGTARMLADPDLHAVLVTTADNFTALPYERWLSIPFLGDGATAVVLTRSGARPADGDQTIAAICTVGCPDLELDFPTQDPFAPPLDEHGRISRPFRMPNRTVIEAIGRCGAQAVSKALADAGLEPDDPRIERLLLPRAGRTIVDFVLAAKLPAPLLARVEYTGAQTGHLGAGDLPANLAQTPPPSPGSYHVLLSSGAGYTSTCVVTEGR